MDTESSITLETALDCLRSHVQPGKAEQIAAYHKTDLPCLGVSNPDIDACQKLWRAELDIDGRVQLASDLWDSGIFEARIAAAKLLTQARMRPDDSAWALIQSWIPQFDGWALADHACIAGQKRLRADPSRIDTVEDWTRSDHMWTRRAALVITLPWAKMNHPKEADLEIRERILGWAASYVPDRNWFIQKAVAWWLRDLSKHDAARTRAFLDQHDENMKPFARKEAARHLT